MKVMMRVGFDSWFIGDDSMIRRYERAGSEEKERKDAIEIEER